MSGKCLGKGQVESHFVGFPQGRNYSRGIGDAWYPSKNESGQANHQISPETCQNCQITNETQTFPTHSHYGQRDFFGRKWTEYGRNRGAYAKLGKLVGESQIECHFVGFPQGRNYKWANALVRPTPIWRAMVIGCYPMWYLKMEDLPSTCGNSSMGAMMINHGI